MIVNLLKASDCHVISINYLGDWGTQYGMLAVGFQKYGDWQRLDSEPIKHLYDVYVKINKDAEKDPQIFEQAKQYFNQMEKGEKTNLEMWEKFRELSIKEYARVYSRLGINFDVYSGESIAQKGVAKVLELLKEKNLLVEKDQAKTVDLSAFKLANPVLVKSDGSTLYLTRDIAMAINRYEQYKFGHMYYVAGAEQAEHFKHLFKILELMGYDWAKNCSHVAFGKVLEMSTRKGTAVFLDEILDEATAQMKRIMGIGEDEVKRKAGESEDEMSDQEELTIFKKKPRHLTDEEADKISKIVALSAVVIQDVQARRIKDYKFNWNRMTDANGDTGPYLMYTHARLASIERVNKLEITPLVDYEVLNNPEIFQIILLISKFPEIVSQSVEKLEPYLLVNFLFELSRAINSANNSIRVKDNPKHIALARLLLVWSVRNTIGNGLRLLGLTPLDKM